MSYRVIKLPQDFDLIERMVINSFHYPENPEWNIQDDQLQSIQESIASYKKLWPLMDFFGTFSYQIRNALRGFIWEEDGQPAGLIMNQSRTREEWEIGTLGVLPEFRRRGIARRLLQLSIADIRARKAKRAFLQVIDGNLPAQTLYLNNGFVDFCGNLEIEHQSGETLEPLLPEGYSETELDRFDWKQKFDHANAITPEEVKQFSPIQPKDFQVHFLLKLIIPILDKSQGTRRLNFLYRATANNEIAGRISLNLRTRKGGVVSAFVRLTPGHEVLGDYLFQKILSLASNHSPNRRITMEMPTWQEDALKAAEKAGFTPKVNYRSMALNLDV